MRIIIKYIDILSVFFYIPMCHVWKTKRTINEEVFFSTFLHQPEMTVQAYYINRQSTFLWQHSNHNHTIRLRQIDFVFPVKGWLVFARFLRKKRQNLVKCVKNSFTNL